MRCVNRHGYDIDMFHLTQLVIAFVSPRSRSSDWNAIVTRIDLHRQEVGRYLSLHPQHGRPQRHQDRVHLDQHRRREYRLMQTRGGSDTELIQAMLSCGSLGFPQHDAPGRYPQGRRQGPRGSNR